MTQVTRVAPATGPRTAPRLDWELRLTLAAIGAVPVSLVGFSTFGLADLETLATLVLVPAVGALIWIVTVSTPARRLTVTAMRAGVIATLLYDLFRWAFLALGWMDRDPIPHIGTGLGLEPGWVYGYLWRYLGNGGGLALAFLALGGRGRGAGAGYGLVVCSGLLAVLQFAPHGQEMLFPLVPATWVVAVVGHLIYGISLGSLAAGSTAPDRSGQPMP